jgi:31-O-methyltransferase
MSAIAEKIRGKLNAARSLAEFARYLRNWRPFFEAYRKGTPLPPLELRGGMTIHHSPSDDTVNLFREIFVDRCYTKPNFYNPAPGDVVVDLGANIGIFAVFLQWIAPGIRVHCFEPGPDTRQRLERNIKSNGLEGAVTIHPYAISDGPKILHLKPAPLAAQRSLFASEFTTGEQGEDGEAVECISLDMAVDRIGADRIQLLKIDIEGAEIELVDGTSQATWDRIDRVTGEYHDRIRPGCRDRVFEVLKARGFAKITQPIISPLEGMGSFNATRD